MLIKGECLKSNLLQTIHDAILYSGSNWTEISSNKEQDYNVVGGGSDGWVFKSPVIGGEGQSIFLTLKSQDFTQDGRNLIMIGLSEDYSPALEIGTNGIHTNKFYEVWAICNNAKNNDMTWLPTDTIEYFIDVLDHRILIVLQKKSETLYNYPQYCYIGYPNLNTNLESPNAINQFIFASNLSGLDSVNRPTWFKTSQPKSSSYNPYGQIAISYVNLNINNPTPNGMYLMHPVYLTGDGVVSPACGILGILDGLYFLPATNISNGDIIKVGDDTYKVFVKQYTINNFIDMGIGHRAYYDSINASVFAIKIS